MDQLRVGVQLGALRGGEQRLGGTAHRIGVARDIGGQPEDGIGVTPAQRGGRHLGAVAGQRGGEHVDRSVGVSGLGAEDAVRVDFGGGQIDVVFDNAARQRGVDLLAVESVVADGVAAVAGGGALRGVDRGGVSQPDTGPHIGRREPQVLAGFVVGDGHRPVG